MERNNERFAITVDERAVKHELWTIAKRVFFSVAILFSVSYECEEDGNSETEKKETRNNSGRDEKKMKLNA